MKFDFSKMQLKNIEGNVVPEVNLHKTLANAMWHSAKTLDLVDKAMLINRGEVVDLSKSEVNEIKQLIRDPRNVIFSFAQKQLLDFIELVQKAEKENSSTSE